MLNNGKLTRLSLVDEERKGRGEHSLSKKKQVKNFSLAPSRPLALLHSTAWLQKVNGRKPQGMETDPRDIVREVGVSNGHYCPS